MGGVLEEQNDHLQLVFGHEGGGGGGRGVGRMKMTTSSSHLDVREMEVVAQAVEMMKRIHLQLTFGREGGGGGGRCIETTKRTTSSLPLDTRDSGGGGGKNFGCHFFLVVRSVTQWEWSVEDKNGENEPRFLSWLVFSRHTFCLLISTLL